MYSSTNTIDYKKKNFLIGQIVISFPKSIILCSVLDYFLNLHYLSKINIFSGK